MPLEDHGVNLVEGDGNFGQEAAPMDGYMNIDQIQEQHGVKQMLINRP